MNNARKKWWFQVPDLGGFKYVLNVHPLFGEMIQFDGCICFNWVGSTQPPTIVHLLQAPWRRGPNAGLNPVQRHRELSPLRSRSVGAAAWGHLWECCFCWQVPSRGYLVIFVIPQTQIYSDFLQKFGTSRAGTIDIPNFELLCSPAGWRRCKGNESSSCVIFFVKDMSRYVCLPCPFSGHLKSNHEISKMIRLMAEILHHLGCMKP